MVRELAGRTPAEKLALNVRVDGECLRWTGAHTPQGYGHLHVAGKRASVHRLSYELHKGPIPEGREIDHLCRVRDCIRPEHLEAVTHRENVYRMIIRTEGRHPGEPRPKCINGHAMTGENVKVKYRKGAKWFVCRTCLNARRRAEYARKRQQARAAVPPDRP